MRSQFTHCIDIGPTILEAAGLPEAKVVDGIEQKPMEGTSFLYSFDDADADERHTVQYFEIFGNRAIYKDGWWAACMLDRIPWDASPPTMARFAPGTYDPEQDSWELYYLPDDYSQANDVAAEHPEKLAELKELFWQEAEKHNVLPLLAGFSVFFGILPPMPTVTTQTFYGDVQNIASGMIPRVYGRSYAIEAELSVPDGGAEGVIVAEADEMGGFSLWVDENGLLHHSYSMMGVEHYKQVSTQPIPTGEVTVRMQFDADRQERSAGRNRLALRERREDRRGAPREDRVLPLLRVRRHGHRPRQRTGRRPRLRRTRRRTRSPARSRRSSSTSSPGPTTTRRRCTRRRRTSPPHTASAHSLAAHAVAGECLKTQRNPMWLVEVSTVSP